jgi:hypothetical protein
MEALRDVDVWVEVLLCMRDSRNNVRVASRNKQQSRVG